jgi:CRP-like cAMP-binding protein
MAIQNIVVPGGESRPAEVGRPQNPSNVMDVARGYFKVELYPHQAVIYRSVALADRLYLLKRGRVRMVGEGKRARSVMAVLRPGDVFGDSGGPEGATMGESAVAQGEVECWTVDGRELKALCQERPAQAAEFVTGISQRLRELRRRARGLAFREVTPRLAEMLLHLAESFGERCPHGNELDLRQITQQDLADLVGAGRPFVSTVINELKREGVLASVGRTLCVRDAKALRRIADGGRT